MRCGNCRESHATVQEVRKCYSGIDLNLPAQASQEDQRPTGFFGKEITDKQLMFLNTLRRERGMEELPDGSDPKRPRVLMTRQEASNQINDLIHPKQQAAGKIQDKSPGPEDIPQAVPEGRYAIPSLTGNNDLDFYKVDRPTEGRWAGYTFVKMVIGGKPDAPVKGKRAIRVLEAIREFDPERAGILFGQKIGQCFKCGRHLTDKVSRDSGAGADCRAKYGIPTVILTDDEDFSISTLPTVTKPVATKKSTALIRRKFRTVKL